MWNHIWGKYIHDWTTHSNADIVAQIVAVVFILFLGIFAIKVVGKKTINTLTIPNILFIFVLSSTLGALITQPYRMFIGAMVVGVITLVILILEILIVKVNLFEKMFVHKPVVLYKNGQYQTKDIAKTKMTIDQIESWIRVQGLPSVDVCRTIAIEFGGNLSFEVEPEWEPVSKQQFEDAMEQIMSALDSKYIKFVPPDVNSAFDEVRKGEHSQKKELD